MYLKDIKPFQFDTFQRYKQAGYRDEIGRGFLTRGGLVHIFSKGKLFQLESISLTKEKYVYLFLKFIIDNEAMKVRSPFFYPLVTSIGLSTK